jgi:hypothetical protein
MNSDIKLFVDMIMLTPSDFGEEARLNDAGYETIDATAWHS